MQGLDTRIANVEASHFAAQKSAQHRESGMLIEALSRKSVGDNADERLHFGGLDRDQLASLPERLEAIEVSLADVSLSQLKKREEDLTARVLAVEEPLAISNRPVDERRSSPLPFIGQRSGCNCGW